MIYFLDTHVVMWLGTRHEKRLSNHALHLLEKNPIAVSPFVRMELGFLFEIGRIKLSPATFLPPVMQRLEAEFHEQPLDSVVAQAERLSWTRDPFDRLIVGHCLAAGGKLVTKDELILQHCKNAIG